MPGAQRTLKSGRRLSTAGLTALTAGTLLMITWAIFATPARAVFPPVAGNCPTGSPWESEDGESGSEDIGGGVTVSWSGDSVTITGGSATICVKAANFNSGSLTLAPGTYVIVEWDNDGTALVEGDEPPAISHVQWIPITTTTSSSTTETTSSSTTETTTSSTTQTTTSSTTGTTTSGTTSTGTTTSGTTSGTTSTGTTTSGTTSVGPTTVTPTSDDETTTEEETVSPTTVTPDGVAFTGPENVIPLGALALTLLTSGSGLLWAGARRRRSDEQE